MQNHQEPAENGQGNGVLDAEVNEKIDEVVRALRCTVDARVGLDCSFADREQAALSIGNEAQRCLLEQELQSIAEAQGRELLINEALYREHRPGSRDYASLCGRLRIQRSTYRLAGVRNGPRTNCRAVGPAGWPDGGRDSSDGIPSGAWLRKGAQPKLGGGSSRLASCSAVEDNAGEDVEAPWREDQGGGTPYRIVPTPKRTATWRCDRYLRRARPYSGSHGGGSR